MFISKRSQSVLTVVVSVTFFCVSSAFAGKPDKPSNGGGGGGGGGDSAYNIIPFAPFDFTGSKARVNDMNENGTAVVGHVNLPGGDVRSAFFDITTQSYTTFPVGIGLWGLNNYNQLVGAIGNDLNTAAYWDDPSASPVTLPPLDGHAISWASSINDSGIIVGSSRVSEHGTNIGVVWRVADGVVVDGPLPLPTLPGDFAAGAVEVNDLVHGVAQIIGDSHNDMNREAVVWSIEIDENDRLISPTVPQGLGTLNLGNPSNSNGYSINSDGDTVGGSDQHAFQKLVGSAIAQLPETSKTVSGGVARDINDSDLIVGSLEIQESKWTQDLGVPHAVLWNNNEIIDLAQQLGRKSGWSRLWEATKISNTGVIAGYGLFDDERGFVMIPQSTVSDSNFQALSIPEPTSMALLALGTVGLAINRRRYLIRVRSSFVILFTLSVIAAPVLSHAAEFIPIENASFANGVSFDGNYVVGSSDNFPSESFRWDQVSGMTLIPDLPGGDISSEAFDVSNNGSVVVGQSDSGMAVGQEAYRWAASGGIQGLGFLPGFDTSSSALAVSGDGSTVVGRSDAANLDIRAFYWTDGDGMQDLGVLNPGDSSAATGVSSDGAVVVGRTGTSNTVQPFRWTSATGMAALPLPFGTDSGVANAVSANGLVAVGEAYPSSLNSSQAVRWAEGSGAQGLGTLTGDSYAHAVDVSADGSVIVGMSTGSSERPFIWTDTAGMRPLEEVLSEAGVDLTDWNLEFVGAISDDGNTIVGWGTNPSEMRQGWVAHLASVPEPSTLALVLFGTSILLTRRRK